ncbi:MAG: SRPBCC family protein, partial [Gemmatimonadales bacterium]
MTATHNGISRVQEWENLRRRPPDGDVNVGRRERWISAVAAAAVAAYGLRRRRGRRIILPIAGALIGRAVSGRCPVNGALGRNSALRDEASSPFTSVRRGEGVRVDERIVLNRPRSEVYQFWRNLENLPRFMDHLQSVTARDQWRSHWIAKGPAGTRLEWEVEIHNEIPNELIAWRSLEGSEVANAGSVHFVPTDNGDTEVRVVLR